MSDTDSLGRLIRADRAAPLEALAAWAVLVLGVFFVLIHLYAGLHSAPNALLFRALHVCTAMVLVFLTRPAGPGAWRLVDLLLIAATLWVQGWFFLNIDTWHVRTVFFRPVDWFTSIVFVVAILEATRRVVGPILSLLCLLFMAHALFADHFPGIFYGPPSTPRRLLQAVFLDSNGIFGTAVSVMANFVVLFILFGVLLDACGGGAFFSRLAFALFGHRTGGPAKAAVVSSAMMGTLSGSAIGNVLTTGVFTIPLMIRMGFRRAFAGGVEAAASNGGIIMPPVMGAVAFIMAEFVGRPYLDLVAAAAIPAILYFLVIFVTVHLEAKKLGLPTIRSDLLPSARAILKREGYLLLPLVLIIGALIAGRSIAYVAVMVTAVTFVIAVVQPRRRITPRGMLAVAEETARSTVGLSVAAAAAGIILGAIFSVGLSFQVAQAAAAAAGEHIWLLLLLSAVMAVIMGMGMTAVAIYLTLVATVIPILIVAGVPPMAAHFFAFYYGIISNITPPVALTAFAAAPIAQASPIAIGVQASRLGISCVILPILFVYDPGLLLEDTLPEILRATLFTAMGLMAFASATVGYAIGPMPGWQRLAMLAAAVLGVQPDLVGNLAGLVIVAGVLALNRAAAAAPVAASTAEEREEAAGGGLFARFARARMETEADAPAAVRAAEGDAEALVREILADPPRADAEARGRWLWAAWGAVVVAALAMELAAANFLHARHPLWWTAAMFAISAGISAAVVWTSRRAEAAAGATAPARPG